MIYKNLQSQISYQSLVTLKCIYQWTNKYYIYANVYQCSIKFIGIIWNKYKIIKNKWKIKIIIFWLVYSARRINKRI